MFDELRHSTSSEVDNEIPLHSLHNRNLALNSAIVEARDTGKDRMEKYIAVKVTQENGWQLQKPTFSEVLTVAKPPTARQQKASLNNAQKQIETMATLLLDSAGLQVTLSEESKPIQLLKTDGKSLHFCKKSDLTLWLYEKFEGAFWDQDRLNDFVASDASVSCMIRDCMFDFRKLNIPVLTEQWQV